MGIFKEVKNTVKNIFNSDDDMIFEDEEIDFSDKKDEGMFPKFSFGKKKDAKDLTPLPSFDASNHSFSSPQNKQFNKAKSNGRIQVYVPKSFEESFNIIRDIKQGFTAMVNVEVANPQISQRIVDVISGAMYALDGDCKKMGEKQYIFSLSQETVGAYDYLPVNGNTNGGFNFNMGGTPFNYMNQQVPQMQQPFAGFPTQQFMQQPMQQPMPQNNQNINANLNSGINVDTNKQQNSFIKPDLNSYYVPPQSQF